ncbi:hypothetical protein C8Q75DRAFT_893859 [Abortiporus biennis]|nr:hypothetical protein C8Q75DRAFT_893859 [Abortiporus biennis]
MSSETHPSLVTKEYTHRAVQTVSVEVDPNVVDTSVHDAASMLETFHLSSTSLSNHSRNISERDSFTAQSNLSPASPEHTSNSSRSSHTSPPEFKQQILPRCRPPTDRTLKIASARIVSLPETGGIYSTRRAFEKSARVVSLPDRLKSSPTQSPNSSRYSDRLDTSNESIDQYVSESQQRARVRVRVRSATTELPYTPSPPSSPESIVIIANRSQLSKGFLRQRPKVDIEDISSSDDDNDGWGNWAPSPPRPIPALHGPLSLPYARCPSGAEGTIIEEQDNLPRMIWGLEGEEPASGRPLSDSIPRSQNQTQAVAVPRKSNNNTEHNFALARSNPIPPRFQKSQEDVYETQELQGVRPSLPDSRTTVVQAPLLTSNSNSACDQLELKFSLPGHGPIDLSDVFRPRMNVPPSYCSDQVTMIPTKPGNPQILSPTYGSGPDFGKNWQNYSINDYRLVNYILPSSSSIGSDDMSSFWSPSFSSGSLSSLASSRSPIILEQLNHEVGHHENTSKMSALEIAQKYHQEQLHPQHNMPPTPPNSTSPIWASRFSPYQSSLVSPNLVSYSALPQVNVNLHQSSIPMGPSSKLSRTSEDRIHKSRFPSIPVASGRTTDPDQSRFASSQSSSISSSNAAFNPEQIVNSSSGNRHAESVSQYSPQRVKQSTNFHPTLLSHRQSNQIHGLILKDPSSTHHNHLSTPLSPESSKQVPQSTVNTYQPTRSVALNQLIQRRLSSVPEEDFRTLRSPSPNVSPARIGNYTAGSSGLPIERIILVSPARSAGSRGHRSSSVASQDSVIVQELRSHDRAHNPSLQTPRIQAALGKLPTRGKTLPERGQRGKERLQHGIHHSLEQESNEGGNAHRGRGRGRGARRARGSNVTRTMQGLERVDGGMTVRS